MARNGGFLRSRVAPRQTALLLTRCKWRCGELERRSGDGRYPVSLEPEPTDGFELTGDCTGDVGDGHGDLGRSEMVNQVLSEAGAGFRQTGPRLARRCESIFSLLRRPANDNPKAPSAKSWKRHFGAGQPFGPGSPLRHPRIAVPSPISAVQFPASARASRSVPLHRRRLCSSDGVNGDEGNCNGDPEMGDHLRQR